jgi:hypothetical protein
MKTALALTIFSSLLSTAAGPGPQDARPPAAKSQNAKPPAREPGSQQLKRLGSVTWDPQAHELTWTVQKGTAVNGEFVASGEEKYRISPDEATMEMAEQLRGFSDQEAVSLHKLLDALSLYCAESVVWWDQGKGTPVDPSTRPEKKQLHNGGPKPVRVRQQPQTLPAPKYRVPDRHLVAMGRAG